MTDTLDRRRSVTAGDFISAKPEGGGVWYFQIYDPGALSTAAPGLPSRSLSSAGADVVLRATLDLEDMWAGAVNNAITKLAIRGFEISDTDDSTLRTRRAQDLIMNFDGPADYRQGVNKLAQDFLLTRNGCFLEVERESKSPNSKPRALWHLDSLRCRRTGNPEYPVVYQDTVGNWHPMRQDQVIFFADMPSPSVLLYGLGRPAAERAFKTIVKLAAIETYFREKITGARALKLVFVSGITNKQLGDVQKTSDADMERRGLTSFKGAVVVPLIDDRPISIAEVDLAGVPDGYNVTDEREAARLAYANDLGVAFTALSPLSNQGFGTGTQARVIDEGEEGYGIAYFPKRLEDKINWLLMPKTTTFVIKTNDLRDQEQKAKVDQLKAAVIMQLVGSPAAPGIISTAQGLNMAADEGIVPKEFLPEDLTTAGTVTDSGDQSKPTDGAAQQLALPDMQQTVQQAMALVGQKDADDALIEAEWDRAKEWAKAAKE